MGVHETCADNGNDNHFSYRDPRTLGINPRRYLNTGFFTINTSRADHREVLAVARQLMAEKSLGLHGAIIDPTEQTMLNLAIHITGIPLELRPIEWNWFFYAFKVGWCDFPRKVIGVHAAGISGVRQKMEHLEAMTKVLGIPR
jgi:hypothetical protein